ncbi:NTE family protein [Amphibacillus marinus]|uniref:NTE family protein n=1 Tax=Amphibacillus marinus TaxID=872970 RepID=A0A1H8NMY9_9BACI|nr:patatin-like phospholipase family protein [Amphibacillus marinus]SEO30748.1 NTE family protein [Amphibacillus marinus]
MIVDGVFSGGGVKSFAYIGALQACEEKGIQFARVAGSSAGAIVAGLLAAGYQAKELKEIMLNLDLQQFLDGGKLEKYFPFAKWLAVYRTLGLYKGDRLELWLAELLKEKGIVSFNDITKVEMKITTADLTLGRLIILPDDLTKIYGINQNAFSVAKAIRMSASLPYFFRPIKLFDQQARKHLLVDGALLSSLPMGIFKTDQSKQKRPVLGFQLQSKENYFTNFQIDNGLRFTKTLIGTMQHAQDLKYIEQHDKRNIIFLDTDAVNVADFGLSQQRREQLIEKGYHKTKHFLQKQLV